MVREILHILIHTVKDTALVLPFLFGVYILIEYMEHASADKSLKIFKKLGPFGPVGGALIGCVPQCGFSVAAANLYSGRVITMGTIVAVFLSTSDEAVPLILANPSQIDTLWKLIVSKLVISIAAGILIDLVLKLSQRGKSQSEGQPFEELCESCGCHDHGIVYSAFRHTLNIFIFIFIITLVLNFAIEFVGEDRISRLMMTDSFFQPFIAALIGFIPNCASSVVITQLYLDGEILSFGSCIAGLCTGAGLGLPVLFKTNKRHLKENLTIVGLLYAAAVISGVVINLIFK